MSAVKSFLSNKGLLKDHVIILLENDQIISDQFTVAGTLNELCVNIAEPILEDIVNHSSIQIRL